MKVKDMENYENSNNEGKQVVKGVKSSQGGVSDSEPASHPLN